MRLDKLSISAQEAFQAAMGVAGDAEASIIEPIHMLKAVLDASENNLEAILKRIGADPAALRRNVDEAIAAKPKVRGGGAPMTIPGNDLLKVIDAAVKAADKMGDSYATTEHLLIALANDKTDAGRLLNAAGVTGKTVEEAYDSLRGDARVTDQTSKMELDALNQYGQNLTQQAREGKLDPVIGRSEEIRRTIQVLSRRTKNNPVLIGEPGTGKTAIVEGLAHDNGLEAALESSVLLDVLAVFVERRGADGMKLASRKSRLEHVACIDGAIARRTCTHDGVQLVNEQDDATVGILHLAQHGLQAVLELAAILRARQHRRDIERDDVAIFQT